MGSKVGVIGTSIAGAADEYEGHMGGHSNTEYHNYKMPYFSINGHRFRINKDAETKSELNIVQTKMYRNTSRWGYNDLQFVNFTGEELKLEIYTKIDDYYEGDPAQPESNATEDFYKYNFTPHSVLKYWAQMGVKCEVVTNLEAYESGTYLITEFSQSNPEHDTVVTNLTLTQYEEEMHQSHWVTRGGYTTTNASETDTTTEKNTQNISSTAEEIMNLGYHKQYCQCNADTPSTECTATYDDEVYTIQKYLRRWGYFPLYTRTSGVLELSGKYCWYTTQAVASLQLDNGLPVTGVFDSGVRDVFLKLAGVSDTSTVSNSTTTTTTNTG